MHSLVTSLPITRFATAAKAEEVAARNRTYENDGWTYKVVASGDRFVIVVYDETGAELGAL